MSATQVIFLVAAVITLGGAVNVVSARRMMHAAFWLIISLLGVSGLFILLGSGFFAVVQVLVYVGAIAILIIFGIMMTRHVMYDSNKQLSKTWWLAGLVCLALFVALVLVLNTWSGFTTTTQVLGPGGMDVPQLGMVLTDPQGYAIAFELSSVLLVAAMLGAIYVALERRGSKE
jgi:NADH-quinone oxidoreductase subunit J